MKTNREIEEENARLRESIRSMQNSSVHYVIIQEGEGKYAARYSDSPDAFEMIKDVAKDLGYTILRQGQFAPKPENVNATETAIQEANKTGEFNLNQFEKSLIE